MIGTTIVIEDRLKEIFAYLPVMTNANSSDPTATYKPIFESGLDTSLVDYMLHAEGEKLFPLIWLAHPYREDHKRRKRVELELSLVLAVKTDGALLSSQRMNKTFKPILYPLMDNILNGFTRSNIVDWDGDFEVTKFENYGDIANRSENVFLWDAIKLEVTIELNNNCLKPIYYAS